MWPRAALVAGDIISFLVFAGVGRNTHHEASGLGAIARIATTAAPFALGWFLVSPFAGAFRRSLVGAPRRMLVRTELAWLAAWPVALVLRWAFAPDHRVPLSFAIVVLIANAVFLGIWRLLFAVFTRSAR
ncbi:MAG TPA: DUF3054 domain-containing protein [Ktedonobacterales bacterium]|nr:DUF3054 domain-containing protein [Ktedonobacterales bacterium]